MVTICTVQWSVDVKPSGHYMYHQFNIHNSTFCPHTVFICFVWISEQTAIISLYNINWLVFITETESVYCAVRTGYHSDASTSTLLFDNSWSFCWGQLLQCYETHFLSDVTNLLSVFCQCVYLIQLVLPLISLSWHVIWGALLATTHNAYVVWGYQSTVEDEPAFWRMTLCQLVNSSRRFGGASLSMSMSVLHWHTAFPSSQPVSTPLCATCSSLPHTHLVVSSVPGTSLYSETWWGRLFWRQTADASEWHSLWWWRQQVTVKRR